MKGEDRQDARRREGSDGSFKEAMGCWVEAELSLLLFQL